MVCSPKIISIATYEQYHVPFAKGYISSNIQFHALAALERLLQFLSVQRGLHPLGEEAVDLLRRATNEARGVEQRIKVALDWVEVRVRADALDQVVLEPELLHLMRRLVRQNL